AVAAVETPHDACAAARAALSSRNSHQGVKIAAVRKAVAALDDAAANRNLPLEERLDLQRRALRLPLLPTTTIGSFPQTSEIRRLRSKHRAGTLSDRSYETALEAAM